MPSPDQADSDRIPISKEDSERVREGITGAIMEGVKDTFTKSLKNMGAINPRIPLPKSGGNILNPGKIFDRIVEEAIMTTGRQHIMESDTAYFDRLVRETRRRLERLPQRHREFMNPNFFY